MAKAMIVFSDTPNGGYKIKVKFDPDIVRGEQMTNAQQIGYAFFEGITGITQEQFETTTPTSDE